MEQYQVYWPKGYEKKKLMYDRRQKNYEFALNNQNEAVVFDRLLSECASAGWERQFIFGHSIFDFFSRKLGVAVEVDGDTHDVERDKLKDQAHLDEFEIITLRVRNKSQQDLDKAIEVIKGANDWSVRITESGFKISKHHRKCIRAFNNGLPPKPKVKKAKSIKQKRKKHKAKRYYPSAPPLNPWVLKDKIAKYRRMWLEGKLMAPKCGTKISAFMLNLINSVPFETPKK